MVKNNKSIVKVAGYDFSDEDETRGDGWVRVEIEVEAGGRLTEDSDCASSFKSISGRTLLITPSKSYVVDVVAFSNCRILVEEFS
ncbi:hypothetical protein H5410_041757 [Solanum commersonii]|uniref:Uncharacterized protein n=1 Tax=Solanum commersonii TaxID=4109 RepID=A0A9J5XSG5_SOLCO|nr:hypothetical protein H5410_041757 [Solanum commersonii]